MKREQNAVVSGIGFSAVGRRLMRDPLDLTAQACLAAIADAGLSADEIDGVSTYPGAQGSTPGISGAGVDQVREMLGLELGWYTGGSELPGQLGSVVNAVLAISAGLAEHVLCFRSVWESTAQTQTQGGRGAVVSASTRDVFQWGRPYGAGYPTYGALTMRRYMHESGATREQLAQIAVTQRHNAAGNPLAVYREPITVDDYLTARMISDPLCLLDCDVPIDGCLALVVSRANSKAVDQARAVRIEALGSASGRLERCADMMWARTDLKPSDIDVAQVYDGFSIFVPLWLEALRLVPKYETGAFIEGGSRIALDGDLPINTSGGQLSAGRLHGYGALLEACVQLRGEGGDRQIADRPEVAAVSSGIDNFSTCLLLTR
jgi:acetyl-CoA acetyltransferase